MPAPVLIGEANNQPSFGGGADEAAKATLDAIITHPITLIGPNGWPQDIDPRDPRLRIARKLDQLEMPFNYR
jgi:hypothetical protein